MIELLAGTLEDELAKPIIVSPISTAIKLIEWTPSDETMRVTFTSGRVYDYPNVTRDQVTALINAPSVGSYLNANFKDWSK